MAECFFTVSGLSDLKRRENKQVFASIILPFDGDKLVSVNEFSVNRNHQENIQIVKNLPLGNGYGYRFTAANNTSVPVLGEFDLQNNYGFVGARYINFSKTHNAELNAKGSLIHFAHRTFLARYVDQSFALVQVPGMENIDVYYRNQSIGKTNKNGYLYIPYLLAYQRNEINLDPNQLPIQAQFTEINKIVVPYDRSGVFVKFDVSIVENVLLTLAQENGEVIPAGAEVFLDSNPNNSLPVGYNGQVFVSTKKGEILSGYAQWANRTCHFRLSLTETEKAIKEEQAICY
ncbi:MAG: fimbria/pilus outer membrane usher protein [Proteobacteria bacterium]|nr:fimbria/pilus outer membrane usher protein [Pseudomonadota bacterium]